MPPPPQWSVHGGSVLNSCMFFVFSYLSVVFFFGGAYHKRGKRGVGSCLIFGAKNSAVVAKQRRNVSTSLRSRNEEHAAPSLVARQRTQQTPNGRAPGGKVRCPLPRATPGPRARALSSTPPVKKKKGAAFSHESARVRVGSLALFCELASAPLASSCSARLMLPSSTAAKIAELSS